MLTVFAAVAELKLGSDIGLTVKKKILPNGKYKGRNPITVNEQLMIGIR